MTGSCIDLDGKKQARDVQVSLFFDFVEAQPAAKGTLMKPDACTDAVIERLRNMTNACEANSSKAGVL